MRVWLSVLLWVCDMWFLDAFGVAPAGVTCVFTGWTDFGLYGLFPLFCRVVSLRGPLALFPGGARRGFPCLRPPVSGAAVHCSSATARRRSWVWGLGSGVCVGCSSPVIMGWAEH